MASLAVALFGLVVLAAGPAFAWLVLAARPDRMQNRRLATLLLVTGLYTGIYAGVRVLMERPEDAYAAYAVFALLSFLVPFLYVRFMATLDTPLRPWLASRVTQGALLAVGLAAQVAWFARPDLFVADFRNDLGFWRVEEGPLNTLLLDTFHTLTMMLGLLVALLAWRRASTVLARRQAGIYAIAFGIRDGVIVTYVVFSDAILQAGVPMTALIAFVPLAELALLSLLAYGILKTQLFDIDLKLKWTVRKGTIAAAFVGVFFVVSEGAQQLFSARFGALAGLVGAGLLVFAIAPLQRFSDRLADTAMPRVRDDPEYRTVRKREVYQAAVEGVLEDGEITSKERTVLARLQDQLGLTASEALAIERAASDARRPEGFTS